MNIPIFPLNGAILFPGTNLPLNIFENRYIDMVDYALSNNRIIGMIQTKENDNFYKTGCMGKITSFTETEDGRYQINLQGTNRFFLKKIIKNKYKFITIDAESLETINDLENDPNESKNLLNLFTKFLKNKKISFDTSGFQDLDTSSLAKIICVISPLDYLTKQMFLEFKSSKDLCKNLLVALEIEIQNLEKNYKIN